MKIMIKNGTIVTSVDEIRADLLIENEKIAAIGSSLEIQADEDGLIWLMIHSGSRNVGLQVAKFYHKRGKHLPIQLTGQFLYH